MRRSLLICLLSAARMLSPSSSALAAEKLPPGVEQVLPRGDIAAVFAPRYVSADEAAILDDAWILGVVIDGQARAYSLNLLNRHEVVNDRIGGTAFAAVW